ncbi:hypothetical protein GQX74_003390 [Glossina fuscipes]|nr:hypothetical protein GQX74_003390 [Glossina fuscipes]
MRRSIKKRSTRNYLELVTVKYLMDKLFWITTGHLQRSFAVGVFVKTIQNCGAITYDFVKVLRLSICELKLSVMSRRSDEKIFTSNQAKFEKKTKYEFLTNR